MKEFVQGTDAQFAALKQKLDANPGRAVRYQGLRLHWGIWPSSCSLDFIRTEAGLYCFRFFPALTAHIPVSEEVQAILQNGFSGSFEEMVQALRVTLAPLEAVPPHTGRSLRPKDSRRILLSPPAPDPQPARNPAGTGGKPSGRPGADEPPPEGSGDRP